MAGLNETPRAERLHIGIYGRRNNGKSSLINAITGQIANCCQPNALLTLNEYLDDYASEDTRKKGKALIERELENITNPKAKETCIKYLNAIDEGKRDFRF